MKNKIMIDIKFRAWDIQYNKMIMPNIFLNVDSPEDLEIDWIDNLGEPKNARHFHMMQFTGLKDKNGKEIYEGDIIKKRFIPIGASKDEYYSTTEIIYLELRGLGAQVISRNLEYPSLTSKESDLKSIKPYSKFKKNPIIYSTIGYGKSERIEIIGNIHNNPDLLTK